MSDERIATHYVDGSPADPNCLLRACGRSKSLERSPWVGIRKLAKIAGCWLLDHSVL
ncbi:MAG TPA: hypothetical protein VEQ18_03765 [Candidatus Nitrosocosmicus sp.]|nr:hypothetical protein [Candidatus Nitrosocosmicus sp.]